MRNDLDRGPGDGKPRTKPLRVAHLLAVLHPSGAERMLQCSSGLWREHGIEPVLVGVGEGTHPFAQALRDSGYETLIVPRNGRTLGGVTALHSALARLEPAVVHVHTESMFPLICGLARATHGVRGVVRSIHSHFVYDGLLLPRRIVFSQVAAALGVVSVAPSPAVADNEERLYHHRPLVVENWVDVAAFTAGLPEQGRAARARLGVAQDDFVVMLLGNCEPVKGHSLLLDSVAVAPRPVVVLHVGAEKRADPAERRRWSQMASRHRLIRLGRRDDVPALLAAADVLAMPSEREGFGIAAAEAFCAGTPVLAAAIPGLGWVTDFRTGRSARSGSYAWAAELGHAADERWRPEWQSACRADAEDARRRFSPERGVAEWRRIYAESMRYGAFWRASRRSSGSRLEPVRTPKAHHVHEAGATVPAENGARPHLRGPAPRRHVVAILTAHNRRELTLSCLRSYFSQRAPGVELRALVVDDGSTDGTGEAVRRDFPAAEVIQASGDLFWARGMATAEAAAVRSRPDYLLWLNDDVRLYPDALERLLLAAADYPRNPVLFAGAVCDPETGETTYGGERRHDWHPMRYSLVPPSDVPVTVDTMNGNVLLVPRETYLLLGGIDGEFAHSYADYDYGLRMRQAGGVNVLIAGHVGTCARNDLTRKRLDRSVPLPERWRFFRSRKGHPLRSQIRYLRRHGGPLWPLFLGPPYVRLLLGRPPPDRGYSATSANSSRAAPAAKAQDRRRM